MSDILFGKTLLIVDDEVDLRTPLVTEFESFGCKVFEAKNGREALQIVKREKLDAVVSDIRMPGGDGIELLKNIKQYSYNFPVVMLITGFSDLSKEDAYDMGAEAILSKPFDLDEIDAAVIRILTPTEKKWQSVIDPKNVKLKIQKTYSALSHALKSGELGIGRGGLFLSEHAGIVGRNELVAFDIRFEGGDILVLEGTGIARWVRKENKGQLPAGCGIEFESLPEEVRKKVTELTSTIKLIPFIPKTSHEIL